MSVSETKLAALAEMRKKNAGQTGSAPPDDQMLFEIWKNTQQQKRPEGPNPIEQRLDMIMESLIDIYEEQNRQAEILKRLERVILNQPDSDSADEE